jgi:hypothetical protein
MTEGSGSGDIPLTNGSGLGGTKHTDPTDKDPDPKHWKIRYIHKFYDPPCVSPMYSEICLGNVYGGVCVCVCVPI